jgi:hypothetical protein
LRQIKNLIVKTGSFNPEQNPQISFRKTAAHGQKSAARW